MKSIAQLSMNPRFPAWARSAWLYAIAGLVLLTLGLGASRILRTESPVLDSVTSPSLSNLPPEIAGTWRWTQDPTGKLTPELLDASLSLFDSGSRWQTFDDNQVLPTGGKSVAWLHLNLAASAQPHTLYLEFERARVLKIEGFYKAESGQWQRKAAGFIVPFNQRALPTQHPTFAIDQRLGIATDYLLRVQHLAPLVLKPRLLQSPGFAESSRQNGLIDGLILGCLLAFCVLCILAMLVTRSAGFVWPLLLALCAVLVFGPSLGLTARYLWPNSGSLDRTLTWAAQPVMAAMTAAALLGLLWHFSQGLRSVRLILMLCLFFCSVLVAFHWYAPQSVSLAQHRGVSLAATLLMLFAAWVCMRSASAQSAVQGYTTDWIAPLVLGLIPVALISVPRLFRALGWIENSDWFELGGVFAYFSQCVLMYIAMVMAKNSQLIKLGLVHALSPVDAQTGLNTWRHCSETIERVIARQGTDQHSASVLAIRVVNHSTVQGAAGFAATQNAVIALGQRLRSICHRLDSIAQLSPTMLVWAIDRALSAEELQSLAQQIRLINAKPYEALASNAPHLSLQLAMACALNPPSRETVETLMDRMASTLETSGAQVQRNLQFLSYESTR